MTEQHTPKVSVIIPVYNVEPYLRECLNSVVDQTLRDIEIICVDDGSTDGSIAILEEFRQKDSRITVLTQENQGQSAARNRGMDVARGEYIYFMDSDDYVDLIMLEKTTILADQMDLDVLVFGLESFVAVGEKTWDSHFEVKSEENTPKILSGIEYLKWSKDNGAYPIVAVAELWRNRFLIDNALRFEEGIIYEDSLFSFQSFMAAKRVYQITDCFYYYRRWGNSTTQKPITHKNIESYFACAEGILKYAFREANTPEEDYEIWREYNHIITMADYYYHYGLSPEEKQKVVFRSKTENELFRQIIMCNNVSDKEYRFLHAVTWLPRNIQRGIRCLRTHGLWYALRRAVAYLTARKSVSDTLPRKF